MKPTTFFKNIPGMSKLVWSIFKVRKYVPLIEGAKAKGDYDEERRIISDACAHWTDHIMEMYDTKFEVSGKENIPDGACVFIGNHQAYADIPAMLYAVRGKQLGFIAKAGFKSVPLLSDWILRIRGLFIPTDGADHRESLRIINQGVELLEQGFSLMIFPEGRRSWSSDMGEFKPGSFKLATKAKVPVVPVTIDGTYRIFEDQGYIMPGHTASIVIHPAIETAGLSREEQKELPGRVEEIVRSGLPSQG